MSVQTVTETLLEDRLQPMRQTKPVPIRLSNGKTLLRSGSFNRLRQFPAYLCRKGSSDVLQWVFTSRTRLSSLYTSHQRQARRHLLLISVYAVVCLLVGQMAALCVALMSVSVPYGLTFQLACVASMATLAAILAHPHLLTLTRNQQTSPHVPVARLKTN